jgi:hypothetical protein
MSVAVEPGSCRVVVRSRNDKQAVRYMTWGRHSVLMAADRSGGDMKLLDSLRCSEKGRMAALEEQDRNEQSGS